MWTFGDIWGHACAVRTHTCACSVLCGSAHMQLCKDNTCTHTKHLHTNPLPLNHHTNPPLCRLVWGACKRTCAVTTWSDQSTGESSWAPRTYAQQTLYADCRTFQLTSSHQMCTKLTILIHTHTHAHTHHTHTPHHTTHTNNAFILMVTGWFTYHYITTITWLQLWNESAYWNYNGI